jgi:hypothetical protein
MTLTPLSADQALDAYFLEARSKLLDLAAILDRIDRGGGVRDPRLERVRQGVQSLLSMNDGRATKLQELFSLAYDPEWKRPTPW